MDKDNYMVRVVDNSTLSQLEREGKNIYKNNVFFRDLSTVMEHPEFREFYKKYFKDADVATSVVMFMKMYDTIDNNSLQDTNAYHKIALTKKIFENRSMRKTIVENMVNWIKGKSVENSYQQLK